MQKRQVGIVTICAALVGLARRQPPLGLELASVVTPQFPGSVRCRRRYQQLRPLGDRPAEQHGVADSFSPRRRHRRVEAQNLAAERLQIGQGLEVALADPGAGVGRRRKPTAHLVPQPSLHLRAPAELHKAPAQRPGDRLVPSNQEGHALVDEALVVKGARALGDRYEIHRRGGVVLRGAFGLDHAADDAPDGVDGRLGADVVLDWQLLQPKDGKKVGQGLEERHCHVGLLGLEQKLIGFWIALKLNPNPASPILSSVIRRSQSMATGDMELRLARRSDVPAIAAIGVKAFAKEPIYGHFFPKRDLYPGDFYRAFADEITRFLLTPGHVVIVAEVDNNDGQGKQVAGYATFIRYGSAKELANWNPTSISMKWPAIQRILFDIRKFLESIVWPNRAASLSVARDYYRQADKLQAPYLVGSKSRIDFRSLAVDPAFQRRGYGETMVQWLGLQAWEEKVPVFGDASTNGLPIYLRNQCKEIGKIHLKEQVISLGWGKGSLILSPMDVICLRWKSPEGVPIWDAASYFKFVAEKPTDISRMLDLVEDLVSGIQNAHKNISSHVIRTPVIRLPWLDSEDREVWAKLECHQHTGSFKYRGAYNALSRAKTNMIVTASAGNHALATAAAGSRLGKDVHLIAPITASELKVNRMMADAEVTLLGQDLYEATLMAMGLAKKSADLTTDESEMLYYVSPYDNVDVAAGAGTVMLEAQEDHGIFDTVVVPLGGGGLAAGVGAWCVRNSPQTKVVCTHPKIFGREFVKSKPIASQLARPTAVSYSDGLAVQLVRKTPFARILQETIKDVAQVTEDETAVAISIALRMQSLLIEGSAATTIAALLKPEAPETMHIKGRVLLLLTGGNISSGSLARSLVSDVSNTALRQAIGLRNILPSVDRCGSTKLPIQEMEEQKRNGNEETADGYQHVNGNHRSQPTAAAAAAAATNGASALAKETRSDLKQWQTFSDRLQAMIKTTAETMQQKNELSARLCLEQDQWCKDVYDELQEVLCRRAKEFETAVKASPSLPKFWVLEERYRILLQQHSAVTCLFNRASAANDQSLRDWFRDLDCQSAAICNYDRYGSSQLRATEQLLARALALGESSGTELLLTSSGMAAYQVVQHFVLQSIGEKGNFVLPPYVYFEGMEQLQAFDFVTVTHAPTFDAEDVIATAEAVDAKVVFLDAIANMVDLPATDVRHFCRTVAHRPGWGDRIVVIDGTTVSGAMPVFDWMPTEKEGPHAPTLLYFESASKYLQFGMDLQMGGLVVYPSRMDATMRTIRRNTGGVMYSRGLTLLPPLDRAAYQERMTRLSRNAEVLRDGIAAGASDLVHVRFPSEWKRFGWRHGGALVTVRFLRDGLNNKDGLEACIDLVLRGAKSKGLPVTKGVSFGFSTMRISSASSMAKDFDPFLRLSVGIDRETLDGLVEVMVAAIRCYADTF
ncbi:hypothetical protein PpBr36_04246 [Pyricularia pennisetigena]|uniref:hypothetical protein n=1 Tax=Pyricularia pennisetigena TaxID=1578925 RepID=UPI001151E66B|nr:hypothetical protein PpBr36_04246 [Pyricularia pennisetigena]TLS26427.1 hypothetical protein PpBr36_04246 [Pyricularia pennisetigena]